MRATIEVFDEHEMEIVNRFKEVVKEKGRTMTYVLLRKMEEYNKEALSKKG